MMVNFTDDQWMRLRKALKMMPDVGDFEEKISSKAQSLREHAEELDLTLLHLKMQGKFRVTRTVETRLDYERL